MLLRFLLPLILASLCACRGLPAPPSPPPAGGEMRTRDGDLLVRWHTLPAQIPIGAEFEIVVEIRRAGEPEEPLRGAIVYLQGFMPDHGHGMTREPRSEELGAGRYRIPAVLLHMEGYWEMSFAIIAEGVAHAADFQIRAEP